MKPHLNSFTKLGLTRITSLALPMLFLTGCLEMIPFANISSVPNVDGLYGDTPGKQNVRGSNSQLVLTRIVYYDFDDVSQAIVQAVQFQGLGIELLDKEKGKFVGSGNWNIPLQGTTCATPYSFAAYVEEIDAEPTTRLTLVLDRHTYCGAAFSPERQLGQGILGHFHKILSTY